MPSCHQVFQCALSHCRLRAVMPSAARIGVVGTGWGAQAHLPQFRAAGCEIASLHDNFRDAEQLAKLCEEHEIGHQAKTLPELCGWPRVLPSTLSTKCLFPTSLSTKCSCLILYHCQRHSFQHRSRRMQPAHCMLPPLKRVAVAGGCGEHSAPSKNRS